MNWKITYTKTRNGEVKYQVGIKAETREAAIDWFYSEFPKSHITSITQVYEAPIGDKKVVTANTLPDGIRHFDRSDWYGYAGAEKFLNGVNPLIAETDLFTIVADANMISVTANYIDDRDGDERVFYMVFSNMPDTVAVAYVARIIRETAGMFPAEAEAWLLGKGFVAR